MSDETLRADDQWDGPRSEGPGSRIGPYTLLESIGEGGFGVVFVAAQEEPIKRRVALKIIKLGMDSQEVLARFDAERQALAMMDHPHIARVLDAGTTANGRPYFVMELVDGEPLAAYCDRHRLTIRQRLALFDQVCGAVQHAHTKGVIHRDLKPGNVLVATHDGEPFAKVIDFGIAKATRGRLTEQTLATELNQVMGTPLYMSPEQASGSADIDTRTDIYSLGVMLYELLTGTTPVEAATLRKAVFAEVQRLICEVDPPRPSVRLLQAETTLAGTATTRDTDPRGLARTLRGELDWIVMKALEKDRARRYETANGLAMDLRRYLAGEPVLAAPPSASYRLRKFVRRNKASVAAGSLVAASLVAGIVGFAWQARIAQARAAELEQVSEFQEAMLAQVDPTQGGRLLSEDVRTQYDAALAGEGVPEAERQARLAAFDEQWGRVNATDAARDLIDRTILTPAVAAIDEQFKDQPLVDAKLRQVLAVRYIDLGLLDKATPLLESAMATRRRLLGAEHEAVFESLHQMAQLHYHKGDMDAAVAEASTSVAMGRRLLGEDDPRTLDALNSLAAATWQKGDLDAAEKIAREAYESHLRVQGPDAEGTLTASNNLSNILSVSGNFAAAEAQHRLNLAARKRVFGEKSPEALTSMGNLASALGSQGKYAEAGTLYRAQLEGRRETMGQDHPKTLESTYSVAYNLARQRRHDEAEPLFRHATERMRVVLGEDHPTTLMVSKQFAQSVMRSGRPADALPMMQDTLARYRRTKGEEFAETLTMVTNVGTALLALDRRAEAEALLVPSEPTQRKALAEKEPLRLSAYLSALSRLHRDSGRFAKAESLLREALEWAGKAPDGEQKSTRSRDVQQELADLYATWNEATPDPAIAARADAARQAAASLDAAAAAPTPVGTPTAR
jgi:serine/threonine protein kinase